MHFPQRRFCHAGEKLQDNDVQGLPKEKDFEEVDLSRNSFSVNGFHSICKFCRLQSNLRILKLFKCGLCDRSADLVASIALENPHNLEEMHLSHNLLTATGAVSIIRAVEQSRGADDEALWLRLERNQIKNASEILVDFEKRGSVCAYRNKWCKHRYCAERRKIHLPYFIHQNDGTDGPGMKPEDADTLDFDLNHRKRDASSQSISQRRRTHGEDWQHFPTEPPCESEDEPDSKTKCSPEEACFVVTLTSARYSRFLREFASVNGYERSRSPNTRLPMHPRHLLEWEEQLHQRERRLKEMERELRRREQDTMALVDVKQEYTGEG